MKPVAIVLEILKADDPFGRRGVSGAFDVAYETDALTITNELYFRVATDDTQDGFDGAILGALMLVLGAERVLAAKTELLASSKKIRAALMEPAVKAVCKRLHGNG